MTGKKALKRSRAPSFWPIHRKEHKWTVKPRPGPHPTETSVPLAVLLREILGVAENIREVKSILTSKKVKVDGRTVTDHRFPVGLMDVVEEVPTGRAYRILPAKGRLCYPSEIEESEKVLKPLKVTSKVRTPGGSIQIGFHDGRTLLATDDKTTQASPGDVLLFDLAEGGAVSHVPLDVGSIALVTGGPNSGTVGKIVDIEETTGTREYLVTLEPEGGERTSTVSSYIFPIGIDEALISLPKGESR